MYQKYVEILARTAASVFQEMTGTEVIGAKAKLDERAPEQIALAHVIEYSHINKPMEGRFILGFGSRATSIAVADSMARKMGLAPVEDLDDIAIDLLNEFFNVIVGQTISAWDRVGLSVTFGTPSLVRGATAAEAEAGEAEAYVIMLSLAFSHIIFRVTFRDKTPLVKELKRILVVEDSGVVRALLCSVLQKAGFDVRQAEDGMMAVEVHQEFNPHVTIMDLVMPRLGGLDAMLAIREHSPQARFIVLTSSARKDEVVTAKTIGVSAYLAKPFKPDALMKAINKALAE